MESIQQDKAVSLGVRPEDLQLCDESDSLIHGVISFIESLDKVTMLYVEVSGNSKAVVAKLPGIIKRDKGDKVAFRIDFEKLHLFDENGLPVRTG